MFVSNGSLVVKTPYPIVPGYSSSWFPSMPPMSASGWPSAYAGLYERQLWVYVVVSKRARATARLPLPVYRRSEDESRDRVPQHPMFMLLSRPNPALSGFNLWLWTSSIFDIYGDAFWLKRRRNGQVFELYPLHPASMTYDAAKWTFDNGTTTIKDIPEADLVHFRDFHPTSMTVGMSRLEPLRATLENEWHARTATSSFWQRGARPGMALAHPGQISAPAQDRLKAQIDADHAGSGRTGGTLILEEGMKPEKMTLTAEEAQYIETRKLNREEVCAAYDMPPPAVHILDRATFSNITEQFRSVYRDTMAPHVGGFEATLETDLRSVEWPDDDVYAEFLMDGVLRGDFETRQDALAKANHMTIAEKRRVENLPFIEGTDRIFLNSATLPLDAIDAQFGPQAPPLPVEPAEDQPAVRSVLGRLGWQKSLDDVDPAKVANGALRTHLERCLAAEKAAGGSVAGLRARLQGKELSTHADRVEAVLKAFFGKQAGLSADAWDTMLTRDLHKVSLDIALLVGRATTQHLGFDPDEYDHDRTVAFLLAVADRYAVAINDTTRKQLETSDPSEVYAKAADSRASGLGVAVACTVTGFAAVEAGRQLAEAHDIAPTKTWIAGRNPRPEHAALNGQTVALDKTFSNGMDWPGSGGGADDVGCNCSITINGGA